MKKVVLLSFIAVFVLTGCATVPPYNPFTMPKEEIKAKLRKVAILPLRYTNKDVDITNQIAVFETRIAENLTACGFDVIPTTVTRPIVDKIFENAGGLYDPETGEFREEKAKAIIKHVREEVARQHEIDAFVTPSLFVGPAPFHANYARWHGAAQSLTRATGLAKAFAPQMQGTVAALSLIVEFTDPAGETLYMNAGGIQVLNYLGGTQLVSIPPMEVLSFDDRNKAAVELALDPLCGVEKQKQKRK